MSGGAAWCSPLPGWRVEGVCLAAGALNPTYTYGKRGSSGGGSGEAWESHVPANSGVRHARNLTACACSGRHSPRSTKLVAIQGTYHGPVVQAVAHSSGGASCHDFARPATQETSPALRAPLACAADYVGASEAGLAFPRRGHRTTYLAAPLPPLPHERRQAPALAGRQQGP